MTFKIYFFDFNFFDLDFISTLIFAITLLIFFLNERQQHSMVVEEENKKRVFKLKLLVVSAAGFQ